MNIKHGNLPMYTNDQDRKSTESSADSDKFT